MLIEWYGHSCFRITLESKTKIVIDPFDNTVGFAQPKLEADIVLISHHHFDHDCLDMVKGNYKTIDKPGEYDFNDVVIKGFESFHDKKSGAQRGKNNIFTINAEGVALCHMGDLGEVPDKNLYEKIGTVDILMIPVGGVFTIDASEAFEITEHMRPNITLPMHYKTMHTKINIDGIFNFLELATGHYDISRIGSNSITVTKDQMKKRSRITVLGYE